MQGSLLLLPVHAGDLRRAKAACERLVLIAGEDFPAERRDLAVILLHCGFLSQVTNQSPHYIDIIQTSPRCLIACYNLRYDIKNLDSRSSAYVCAGSLMHGARAWCTMKQRRPSRQMHIHCSLQFCQQLRVSSVACMLQHTVYLVY